MKETTINIETCAPILTVSEAAEVLRVSDKTVYTLIRAGKIFAVKVSSRLYRVSRDSLKQYLNIA